MIDVTLSNLILVCLAAGLGLVMLWWIVGVRGVRRTEKKRLQGVVTCRICGVRYESDTDVSACPACGTPNELQPPVII